MGGIRWIEQGQDFDLGFGLVFARGIEPMELIRRLNGELLTDEALTRQDANSYDDDYRKQVTIARAGVSGEWAYAVGDYGPLGPVGGSDDVVAVVSAGTEAVSYSRTINWDTWFSYGRGGQVACFFDPCLPVDWHVFPGPLAQEFTVAGLPHGGDMPEDSWERILGLGESTFGLDLPREDVMHSRLLAFRLI